MNDIEIMEQYINYEPFFGDWYIRRFIEANSTSSIFEIVKADSKTEQFMLLKIINISLSDAELETLHLEKKTDADIQQILQQRLDETMETLKINVNGEHELVKRKDGFGWLILQKTESVSSQNLSHYQTIEIKGAEVDSDKRITKISKKEAKKKYDKKALKMKSQDLSLRVDAKPHKWILWFHAASLFAAGYAAYLVAYYNYENKMVKEVGLYVWLLSVLCFIPSIFYGCLYFKREFVVSGLTSKFVTRFKGVLSLTFLGILISIVGLIPAGFEALAFFYFCILMVSMALCLPLNIYGYICYFKGKKTEKQRRCMFWLDKLGVLLQIGIFLCLVYLCILWDVEGGIL